MKLYLLCAIVLLALQQVSTTPIPSKAVFTNPANASNRKLGDQGSQGLTAFGPAQRLVRRNLERRKGPFATIVANLRKNKEEEHDKIDPTRLVRVPLRPPTPPPKDQPPPPPPKDAKPPALHVTTPPVTPQSPETPLDSKRITNLPTSNPPPPRKLDGATRKKKLVLHNDDAEPTSP